MNRNLEKYIFDHISPEDPVLEDLYRQTHIRFVNPNMASGHLQGSLLEFISFMIKPEKILEIGTFTGYSGICLAKGLAPGGKLVTIEINDELSSFSHSYFVKAGLEDRIEQVTGNALEIIPKFEMKFDLVFIDADKRDYCEYYRQVRDKLEPGGIILADNVLWGGAVLDNEANDPQLNGIREFNDMISRDSTIEKTIIPVRDGLMLIRKKN
jgi:predicted O-methyltransferase YrrM